MVSLLFLSLLPGRRVFVSFDNKPFKMWKLFCISMLIVLEVAVAPPVDAKKEGKNEQAGELDDFGLEYGRYLQQVVQALEEDKEFAKKLENVTSEQIRNGHIAKELEFVKHNVRSKLDELKRIEVDRLRKLIQQQMERTELGLDRKGIKVPKHLDVENPHSFEIDDLKKLIQTATKDLEELDRQRREDFKKYELEKEASYRESLKNMTVEEKKKAEEHHDELMKKHKDHPKIHHPGSKPQLEQVWEEQDHMPREEFNPKTFFAMHDINGDGHLDVEEVEALLIPEVKKLYDSKNEEDDPAEMEEEFHRMREHIFNETDKNKDGLISLLEFIKMTDQQDFKQDEGWKGLDEQQVYSEQELEEYMRQRQMYPQGHPGDPRMYYDVGNPQQPGLPPHINYQGQPQQYPQGHHQQYPQGHHQQYPQGHPQQYPQGHPQQYPQGHPQQYPQGHPQQYPQGHPQQYPQGHPQQYPQGHPQQYPQGQPQQYPQGQPQQFQQPQHPQFQQPQHPQFQQPQHPQFQQGQPQQLQQGQTQQFQQGQPQHFQQGQPQQGQPQQAQHQQVQSQQSQQFQAAQPQVQQMGNNIQNSNPQVVSDLSQHKPEPQVNNPSNPNTVQKNEIPAQPKDTMDQASNKVPSPKQ